MFDLTINPRLMKPHAFGNSWKPPQGAQNQNIKFNTPFHSLEIKPKILFSCPKCGAWPVGLVAFARRGGVSLSKNKCLECGHVWGPDE